MKKIISVLAVCGFLFGADFSKVSNEDMAKMAGKVDAKDYADYFLELQKRFEKMAKDELKAFRKTIHEFKEKNQENMTLKELKEKRAEILKNVEEKVKSMSKEECKKTRLCDLYKHLRSEKHGCLVKEEKKHHKKHKKETKQEQ
ncbi:DUF1104 domain-containing protein [Helicobacter anatolicus]|uniref:DUF1104 domain-containing protein n=1 Tax=Helicobacter anatolicus TaxID=2905874 RepID=UPI001E3A9960|nr:DUF1104 domain-containing protein [Helicobacter anatolicus]MCE3040459.1 DUF1104 domain-containing protein [Helicobacter anatolicus]